MSSKESGSINAIDRALELIDVLFRQGRDMGISELSRELNVYKSTVHRTLVTLERHGYVVQSPETNRYGLGPKLYAIGMAAEGTFMLRETVRPFVAALFAEFRETVNVCVPDVRSKDYFRFLIIHREEDTEKYIRVGSLASSNSECHCSSIGKSLLAFWPGYEGIVKNLPLRQHTSNTLASPEALLKNLRQVRECGYAVDAEELEIGLMCIGVPVLDKRNIPVMAMSISGPTTRIRENFDAILARLQQAAKQIAQRLS